MLSTPDRSHRDAAQGEEEMLREGPEGPCGVHEGMKSLFWGQGKPSGDTEPDQSRVLGCWVGACGVGQSRSCVLTVETQASSVGVLV